MRGDIVECGLLQRVLADVVDGSGDGHVMCTMRGVLIQYCSHRLLPVLPIVSVMNYGFRTVGVDIFYLMILTRQSPSKSACGINVDVWIINVFTRISHPILAHRAELFYPAVGVLAITRAVVNPLAWISSERPMRCAKSKYCALTWNQ